MAYFQTIYTCALFLALFAGQETIFSEGRQLKPTKRQELSFIQGQTDLGKDGGSTNYSHQKPTRKENNIQVSAVARKKEMLLQKAPIQTRGFGDSAKESAEDFRPTAPGSSPGVGHSFADKNVDIQPEALGNISGGNVHHVQTTLRGHNPGADHSLPSKKAKPIA